MGDTRREEQATENAGNAETGTEGATDTLLRASFRVPAALTHRSLAIDFVATLAEHVKAADTDFRYSFTTAFGEAFNNVAIHGYPNRTDGMLDVEAEVGPHHMILRLKDNGAKMDLSAVPLPALETLPEGGLGIFMIHALVDEVVYTTGSQSGAPNVLTLTKRTASGTAVEQATETGT